MKTELIERGSEVNEAFFVRRHAGFQTRTVAVGDGLARLTDGGILQEILLQSGVGGTKRHRGRSVAVVNHVVGWKKETGAVPRTPLVVGVDGPNAHVHRGSVLQSKGGGKVVSAGSTGGCEG